MKYEVEYAIGYSGGAWEAFWVAVDVPEPDCYGEKPEYDEFMERLQEAAGEQLLEDLGPNPNEVFAVVLSFIEKKETN